MLASNYESYYCLCIQRQNGTRHNVYNFSKVETNNNKPAYIGPYVGVHDLSHLQT